MLITLMETVTAKYLVVIDYLQIVVLATFNIKSVFNESGTMMFNLIVNLT